MKSSIVKLVVSFAMTAAAAVIGSLATREAVEGWYATLQKPAFTPPGWVFGPAWTVLYIAMATALFLAWRAPEKSPRVPILLFTVQLALNALWSVLFFGLHQPLLALIEIVALWILILLTTLSFLPRSRAAAALMVPYLLWVLFATALNLGIVLLNPGL